jgi:hypothetical protein
MDEAEFRCRVPVYIERDLPDLAEHRHRTAAVLSNDLWGVFAG